MHRVKVAMRKDCEAPVITLRFCGTQGQDTRKIKIMKRSVAESAAFATVVQRASGLFPACLILHV